MKSTVLVTQLKEVLGASSNDEILELVQNLIVSEQRSDIFGVTLCSRPQGAYTPMVFGVPSGPEEATINTLNMIRLMMLHYIENVLIPEVQRRQDVIKERQIRQKLEQEMKKESADE